MREVTQEAIMALLALTILALSIYGAVCLYQSMIRVSFAETAEALAELGQFTNGGRR